MSSTRGSKKKLSKLDDYQTPYPYAHQIARQLSREGYLKPGMSLLEPCAGEGRIIRWCQYFAHDLQVTACEINDKYFKHLWRTVPMHDIHIGDFLGPDSINPPYMRWDLVVTNPPFALAEEIARKCLRLLKPTGRLVMLQRQAFFCGQDRNVRFWSEIDYDKIYWLTGRPHFMKGGNDSADYGWTHYLQPNKQKYRLRDRKVFRGHERNTFERPRQVEIVHLPKPADEFWTEVNSWDDRRRQRQRGVEVAAGGRVARPIRRVIPDNVRVPGAHRIVVPN